MSPRTLMLRIVLAALTLLGALVARQAISQGTNEQINKGVIGGNQIQNNDNRTIHNAPKKVNNATNGSVILDGGNVGRDVRIENNDKRHEQDRDE